MAPGNRYIVEHEPEHVGKRVIYLLRWITGKGIKGPWSVPIETTVVG